MYWILRTKIYCHQSAKHNWSTEYEHLMDIKTLTSLPEFKDIMLSPDGLHKPVCIITCDGRPVENPRYKKQSNMA